MPKTVPSRRRMIVFRVVAALAGAVFLPTLPQAISPWGPVTLSNMEGVNNPDLHRWSAALAGGPDLGMAGALLFLAWRPTNAPLVLQWAALAGIVFLAFNVPFVGPFVAVFAIPIVLVLVAYPKPRALLTPPWADGVNMPLLVVGVVVAALLAADAARAMAAQIQSADELARNYDWAANSEHLVNVGLAALLAGMCRPGSRVLTVMVAAVLAFMGAAAITVPSNPGSWGTIGGSSAIAGSLAVLAAAAYAWRRDRVGLEPPRAVPGQSSI